MGLVYLFIKIYPFFGVIFVFVLIDLARTLKRKGNRAWIGLLIFAGLFLLSTAIWIWFRGDKFADTWYIKLSNWFRGR